MNLSVVCTKDWLKLLVVYLTATTLVWLVKSQFCLGIGLVLRSGDGGTGPRINAETSKPIIMIPLLFAYY